MEKQITLGTKTIYGEIHAIDSSNGECTYFCVDRFDALNIIPEEMIEASLAMALTAQTAKAAAK